MKEIEGLNKFPVNRKAHRLLQNLGETIDEGSLYSVQLASWAIRTGKIDVEPALRETVEAMRTWRYERLAWFLDMNGEATDYGPAGYAKEEDVIGLASMVLADIENRIIRYFPWYYDVT